MISYKAIIKCRRLDEALRLNKPNKVCTCACGSIVSKDHKADCPVKESIYHSA